MGQFSLKELYDVKLKAAYPIIIGERVIEVGENIGIFNRINMSNFKEITKNIEARGGYGNQGRVFWNSTEELRLEFTQGIFSEEQLALMTNANLVSHKVDSILLSQREITQSDDSGKIILKYIPESIFIYLENGQKIQPVKIENNQVFISNILEKVIVDYTYNYINDYKELQIGRELTKGFLTLEGRTKIKDEETGQVTTGIIKIPKLKIISNLSMILGTRANPIMGRFEAVAYPVGFRGNSSVMELYFLSNDIDSDV